MCVCVEALARHSECAANLIFDELDLNHDGVVDRAEFLAAFSMTQLGSSQPPQLSHSTAQPLEYTEVAP